LKVPREDSPRIPHPKLLFTYEKRLIFQDIRSYFRNIPLEFPYPIISDESRELAVRLDMLDNENRWDPVVANTIRALYVIGPDFKVKLSMFYPNTTGRNVQ
jgi:alkyl hydroperoxide reductase subunit AhpC